MFKKKKEKKDRQSVNLDHGQCCLVPPGQVTILRGLGEGQYGSVQLGEWKQPAVGTKYVAIKSLKNTHIDGVLSAMLKEAAIMQKLQNPYIVTLFGISLPEGDEPLKLVTEYADWGSLEENLVKRNEWVCQVSTLGKFAAQVAHGMQYLASQQLVHRDLATRNILVFSPDLVKICDFGLARTLEGSGARELTAHQKLALAWVPPETITRSLFTPTSDVWSYGVTLWEMFTFGKQPFSGLTFQQIKRIVNEDSVSYLSKPLACPDGFYDVMLSCWKREPEERPTFEDISKHVSQIQLKEGITKTSHDSSENGYLSYKCKQKVTLIARCEEKGIVLVQLEGGSVGKVEEKNINFSSKAAKEKSATLISRPFNVKKGNPPNLIPELITRKAKNKSALELPSNKQVERKQDEQVKPIHSPDKRYSLRLSDGEGDDTAVPAYPDPYPNMDLWHNQPVADEFRKGTPMKPIASETAVYVNDDSSSQIRERETLQQEQDETLQQDQEHTSAIDTEIKYTSMGYADPSRDNEYTSMGHMAPNAFAEELQKMQGSNVLPCAAESKMSTGNNENTHVDPNAEYATLPRTTTPLRPPRPDRTQSESELQGMTYNENLYDVLWGGGRDGHAVNQKPPCPEIPARLDLVKPRAATVVERKRTPIPLPRQKKNPTFRPVSDGQLAKNTTGFGSDSTGCPDKLSAQGVQVSAPQFPKDDLSAGILPNDNDRVKANTLEMNRRVCSRDWFQDCTLGVERASRENAAGASNSSSNNGSLQEVESNFQQRDALNHSSSAKRADANAPQNADVEGSQGGAEIIEGLSKISMGERLGSKGQNAENHNLESESPFQLATVQCRKGKANSDLLEPETGHVFTGMAEMNDRFPQEHEVQLVGEASAMTTPNVLDLASQRPSEIKTTPPPPLPPKLGNYLDSYYAEPFVLSPSPVIHPAVLIQPPPYGGDSFALPPLRNTLNSDVHGSGVPQGQPQFDHLQTRGAVMSHHDDRNSEPIRQKILQIQGVCQDVTSDFCYAALVQHGGNVEEVIRVVKPSQLAATTGKSYQFCERTLKHCNWDLDRAANYIMDNFADKEV